MHEPAPETRPQHPSGEPLAQEPARPSGRLARLMRLFPTGQFVRYLAVGGFNTLFGYISFVVGLTLLNHWLPPRYLYLTVVAASLVTLPINITVAYFGYKIFVFRTQGHYLSEWLKCFAVYGVGTLPGLVLLSAVTRGLQSWFHRDHAPLHARLVAVESHLSGAPLRWVQHIATGQAMAGYIAGALMIFFTTIYSFLGHRNITFRRRATPPATPIS